VTASAGLFRRRGCSFRDQSFVQSVARSYPRAGGGALTERRTVWDFATAALREQSPSVLHGGLIWVLRAHDGKDPRDLMLGLAPFHDCARRLGLDVRQVFNDAADAVDGEAAQVARDFGQRSDVTADAFAYVVESGPDGPMYRPRWPD
jgi:hypothetical protein